MPSPLQSASGTAAATSVPATFSTANLSAGSKIIAFVSVGATSAPALTGCTATGSNVLTQMGTINQANARIYIFAVDATGDGSHASMVGTKPTVTATCGSTVGLGIVIQEVPGLLAGNTTAVLDGSPGTLTGATATTGSPAYSDTVAGQYKVSAYGDFGTGFTVATAAGWTPDPNNVNASTNSDCLVQYRASTGGTDADGFTNADTGGWAIVEVAFKLASASAGTPGVPYSFPAMRTELISRSDSRIIRI